MVGVTPARYGSGVRTPGHAGAFACTKTIKRLGQGEHRARTASETLALVVPMLTRFGITRVADITGLDNIGIPVVMVTRPNGRSLSVSQGKGLTLDAAKASGIMESVEQFHAEHIDRPVRLARFAELARSASVASLDLLARPASCGDVSHLRLPWIEGRALATGDPVWVPLELVDIDATIPSAYRRGHFVACTNGLASGNNLAEAEVHALCEVIERDARTLWELRGARTLPQLDLASVDDVACRGLLDRFASAGVIVAAWDMTSDIGIASFVVIVADHAGARIRSIPLAEGAGCHPERGVALRRALTEAAQARLTVIAGSRDDIGRGDLNEMRRALRREQTGDDLITDAATPGVSFQSVPTAELASTDGDRRRVLDALACAGVAEPIAVDLTRLDVGIPVVKVIVPGLEPALERRARHGARYRRVVG